MQLHHYVLQLLLMSYNDLLGAIAGLESTREHVHHTYFHYSAVKVFNFFCVFYFVL